jgi:serine/threonine-protein kinase
MTAPTCHNCGGQILPGDRFCAACGAQQEVSAEAAPPRPAPAAGWDRVLERLRAATAGKYEIRQVLGSGGMAAVFLAQESRLNRRVAIKVMAPGLMLAPGMVERFRQEAVTVAALNHPNIVTIYTVEETEDLHYFVMKYVPGPSLDKVIRRDGPLPQSVVRVWLAQVGSALGYAHGQGVIHRDVKPGNILLEEDGSAIVTDFGIAKVPRKEDLTLTGVTLGTPAYMSPEQCASRDVTAKSDQYSLGIVAYEMLTGAPPFTGPSLEVMKAHVDRKPRPIAAKRPRCPPELAGAVEQMLEKDPARRWPTILDMVATIGGAMIAPNDPIRAQLAALAAPGATPARQRMAPDAGRPTTPPPSAPRITPRVARVRLRAPVGSLTLSPPGGSLIEGDSVRLEATAHDALGALVEERVVLWSSSDPGIAKVSESGVLVAVAPGSVTVRANCEGTIATTTLQILRAPVASVHVWPWHKVVPVGGSARLAATVRDTRRRKLADRAVAWSSGNPAIAEVSEDGAATAVAPGAADVRATCEGKSGRAILWVTPPGALYWAARLWWAAPAGAFLLLFLWLAVRPGTSIAPSLSDDTTLVAAPAAAGAWAGATDSTAGPTDRTLAAEAQDRAHQARQAALDSGANDQMQVEFDALDLDLQTADRQFRIGNFAVAAGVYLRIADGFSGLADRAAAGTAVQSTAYAAQEGMQQQRQSAEAAGGRLFYATRMNQLDTRMAEANRALREGRYADAQSSFGDLRDEYQQVAQYARQRALGEARSAQTAAEQQRRAALTAGAERRAAEQLAALDRELNTARTLMRSQRYLEARTAFQQLASRYSMLATELAAQPAQPGPAVATDSPQAAARPGEAGAAPPVAPAPEPPGEVLGPMIERFRQLFEQENVAGMAAELYKAELPREDADLLRGIFGRVSYLRARLVDQRLQASAGGAVADIELSLDFRQEPTGRRYEDVRRKLRLSFESTSGGWRLVRVAER